MNHLNGKNIRSGLELEVPVEQIFAINLASEGDIRVKNCENSSIKEQEKDFINALKRDGIQTYKEHINTNQLNETMLVSVFKIHTVTFSKYNKNQFDYYKDIQLVFTNNKIVSFEEFCFNIMTAQAFSGNFPQSPDFHLFNGMGDISIEEIAGVYPLIVSGNCTLDYFFIYYKNILSSVSKIFNGTMGDDVKSQKSYISDKEYKALLKEVNEQKKEVNRIISDSF